MQCEHRLERKTKQKKVLNIIISSPYVYIHCFQMYSRTTYFIEKKTS
jgi:hypothetical protein